jgi:hypothetical protein
MGIDQGWIVRRILYTRNAPVVILFGLAGAERARMMKLSIFAIFFGGANQDYRARSFIAYLLIHHPNGRPT